MYQLPVKLMPHLGDMTFFDGIQNGTARFGQMMAVVKTAMSQIGTEFPKGPFKHAFRQMIQTEFLKPRRIDDSGIFIDPVHSCIGSRVFA